MRNFKDKVAVVTGGASGIGLAMARRFVREGMRVIIADVEVDALTAAERKIRDMGATALGVRTDVSRSQDIEALAAKTLKAFGGVHIVCNNAGVGGTWGALGTHSGGLEMGDRREPVGRDSRHSYVCSDYAEAR